MALKPQPLVGQAFLEGRLDRYRDFLKQTTNAELLDASEDFCFEITSVETPNLVVREVHTRGQASNGYEQGDAFFGLMLSHGPGAFSTLPAIASACWTCRRRRDADPSQRSCPEPSWAAER